MNNVCDVPSHLHNHIYWRTESSWSQEVASSNEAADSRKRQREQDSSSIVLEESPQRLLCEDADVLLEWSSSPQPSTTSPQARLDGVQLEEAAGSQQEDQSRDLQDPVDDDIVSLSLWPTPYLSQSSGLPPLVYDAVVETFMSWLTDSPYNPEM